MVYFISFFLFKNCPKILSIFNILPKKNLRKVIVKAQQYMYMKYVTHECLSHRRQFMDETAARFKLQTFRVERNNTIGKYVQQRIRSACSDKTPLNTFIQSKIKLISSSRSVRTSWLFMCDYVGTAEHVVATSSEDV